MNIEQIKENSIGKLYNVEFEMGNGKHQTFSGTLLADNGRYFGFEIDGCIMWLERNRLVWMLPIHEKHQNGVDF